MKLRYLLLILFALSCKAQRSQLEGANQFGQDAYDESIFVDRLGLYAIEIRPDGEIIPKFEIITSCQNSQNTEGRFSCSELQNTKDRGLEKSRTFREVIEDDPYTKLAFGTKLNLGVGKIPVIYMNMGVFSPNEMRAQDVERKCSGQHCRRKSYKDIVYDRLDGLLRNYQLSLTFSETEKTQISELIQKNSWALSNSIVAGVDRFENLLEKGSFDHMLYDPNFYSQQINKADRRNAAGYIFADIVFTARELYERAHRLAIKSRSAYFFASIFKEDFGKDSLQGLKIIDLDISGSNPPVSGPATGRSIRFDSNRLGMKGKTSDQSMVRRLGFYLSRDESHLSKASHSVLDGEIVSSAEEVAAQNKLKELGEIEGLKPWNLRTLSDVLASGGDGSSLSLGVELNTSGRVNLSDELEGVLLLVANNPNSSAEFLDELNGIYSSRYLNARPGKSILPEKSHDFLVDLLTDIDDGNGVYIFKDIRDGGRFHKLYSRNSQGQVAQQNLAQIHGIKTTEAKYSLSNLPSVLNRLMQNDSGDFFFLIGAVLRNRNEIEAIRIVPMTREQKNFCNSFALLDNYAHACIQGIMQGESGVNFQVRVSAEKHGNLVKCRSSIYLSQNGGLAQKLPGMKTLIENGEQNFALEFMDNSFFSWAIRKKVVDKYGYESFETKNGIGKMTQTDLSECPDDPKFLKD